MCLQRAIPCTFARKAKSDLVAYESLKAKREAELEELYKRPFEDIAVEEFLDQLPKPQIEEWWRSQSLWTPPKRRRRMPHPVQSTQKQGLSTG